jgi:hypothetical protein
MSAGTQPTGQPNAATTTQGNIGTTGTTTQGQPQMDPNTMAQFQKYMQMMQGMGQQQGVMANQGQFWSGRPQRLGFGLTRDFNYGNSYSPVDWKVPEGTKHIRQEVYKDRGKWYNPFDTKRVTDYYADPSAPGAAAPGTNPNETPEQGDESDLSRRTQRKIDNAQRKTDRETARGEEMFPEGDSTSSTDPASAPSANNPVAGPQNNNEYNAAANAPGYSGAYSDANGDTIPDYLAEEDTQNTVSNDMVPQVSQPDQGTDAQYDLNGNPISSISSASEFTTLPKLDAYGRPIGNTTFQERNRRMSPSNEKLQELYNRDVMEQAYGGSIPSFEYAYGGYIPEAKNGITAGKEEFSDPNMIGRKVEESAYTFDPKKLGTSLFSGKGSLTGMITTAANAMNEEENILDPARKQFRSSDAATANTGQSGFGSAERAGQMGGRGWYNQYGKNIGNIGFEGNNVITKKGGSINTQYSKGKVYSLTMDQIKAIEAAGGKVEYIK